MSIRVMARAWDLELPAVDKLVLLALADNANDEGDCWPSVATLTRKTGLSERSIQAVAARLEARGLVRRGFRSGRSTVYRVTPAGDAPPQLLHPRTSRTPPPQDVHPTPAAPAPRTINEPSKNQREGGAAAPAPAKRSASRIPEGWQPTPESIAYAERELPNVDVPKLVEAFTDYWSAAAGANARKLDWQAAWRTWVRRELGKVPPAYPQKFRGKAGKPKREPTEEEITEARRAAAEANRREIERLTGSLVRPVPHG